MGYDAIIIGSGMSGLAAGIRLAMFNKKVCIVEKHTVLGGLNSYYVRKNRTFDVGLHAMTNFTPKGVRNSPLGKLLKQLRFSHDDFRLCQQHISEIRFPEHVLRFTNDFEFFRQDVADQFPQEIDGFNKLVEKILSFDELNLNDQEILESRPILERFIRNPILIDMLNCPLMYYGNAREGDMDFYQFVIMFKSIFIEGFAKPVGGMHYILHLLEERFKKLGGELRMGSGVTSINAKKGTVESVNLANGEKLVCEKVTSGVLCCSNNFNYPQPLKEGLVRLTNMANFAQWDSLPRTDYIAAKKHWRNKALESVFTFFPDFRDNMVFLDSFTPKTIKKYTGHLNGAVYGSPRKIKNGKTPVNNLFICGTDQGFLGIIGATLSGISMANLHVLRK